MREILYRRNNVILQYTVLRSLDAQVSISLKLLGPLRLIVASCLFGPGVYWFKGWLFAQMLCEGCDCFHTNEYSNL